jgi:hypothetical protein
MPAWDEVVESMEPASSDLAQCDAQRAPTYVRVSLTATGGLSEDVIVASSVANSEVERCIGERLARVPFPASKQAYSFVAKLDPKMSLTELVLRSAQRRLEEARASHAADADAAQQRLWMLSEQRRAAQAKKREEAERRAVDYARQPDPTPFRSNDSYPQIPLQPYNPPSVIENDSSEEHGGERAARRRIAQAQRDADRMRRGRIDDERRLREQRSEEVQQAEERARFNELESQAP